MFCFVLFIKSTPQGWRPCGLKHLNSLHSTGFHEGRAQIMYFSGLFVYHEIVTDLNISHILAQTKLWDGYYYCPYFTDEEIRAPEETGANLLKVKLSKLGSHVKALRSHFWPSSCTASHRLLSTSTQVA